MCAVILPSASALPPLPAPLLTLSTLPRSSSANVYAIQRFAQEIKACRSSAMEVQRQVGALKVANGVPLEEKDAYMRLYYPTTTVPVGTLSA